MSDESTEAWEYRVLRPPREPAKKEARDPTAEFNELGSDGWKLIETVDYVGGGTKFLVFRRPADGGEDDPDDVDDAEDAADLNGSEDAEGQEGPEDDWDDSEDADG